MSGSSFWRSAHKAFKAGSRKILDTRARHARLRLATLALESLEGSKCAAMDTIVYTSSSIVKILCGFDVIWY